MLLEVFVAADVSASVGKETRQTIFDALRYTLRRSAPPGTPIHFVYYDTVARTDPRVVTFYEPRDLDAAGEEITAYVPRPEKGTSQALALSRLQKEASGRPAGAPNAFILLTDGEDMNADATRLEARKLSNLSGFRALLVIGTRRESKERMPMRDKLYGALEPLGERRIVCGEEVDKHELDLWTQKINP